MMSVAQGGCDVTLPSMSFSVPTTCASCLSPARTTLASRRSYHIGKLRRSIAIPYCGACATRIRSARRRRTARAWATVGFAPCCACVGFVVPALPVTTLAALSAGLAFIVGLAARRILSPPRPEGPATSTADGEAVTLVSFRDYDSVLHCANPAWAAAFARTNETIAVPRVRRARVGAGTLVLAVLMAPATAGLVWLDTHQVVFIDNAGAQPLALWVDGTQVATVEPRTRWRRPPSVRVPYGRHAFGYSKLGAGRPATAVEADIVDGHGYLYNPGATACYAIVGAGDPSPQPITELYRFAKVDRWLDGDETAARGRGVSVQRDEECMERAERGCDRFIACRRAATDARAASDCARISCVPALLSQPTTTHPKP